MAAGLKNIKIRFTGDAKDLKDAADKAARAVAGFAAKGSGLTMKIGQGIADSIGGAVESLPPMGKLVGGVLVAGLGAVAAPAIGAAVSAGVLLGLGGGVLALGIKQAAASPEVKAAAGELKKRWNDVDTTELEATYKAAQERMTTATGDEAKKRAAVEVREAKKALDEANAYNKKNFSLKDAAQPLVGPMVEALKIFQEAADEVIPKLGGMFEKLAPVVVPLAEGLVKMAENALPGVEKAVSASVPLFETLAEKLPEIGTAISNMFSKIADSGPEANQFFSDFLDLIILSIEAFGTVIGWLASFYTAVKNNLKGLYVEWLTFKVNVIGVFRDILEAAYGSMSWMPGLGPKLAAAKGKFADFAADANAHLQQIKDQWAIRIIANFETRGFKGPSPGDFTGRASGGPVRAGSSYLVGERGPEIVTFGSNGNVTPNRELTGGGDVYELHIDLGGDVQRVITFSNRDLKRRTKARTARLA